MFAPSSVVNAHTLENVVATATARSLPPQPLSESDPQMPASVGQELLGSDNPRPSLQQDASSDMVACEVQAACHSQSALSLGAYHRAVIFALPGHKPTTRVSHGE